MRVISGKYRGKELGGFDMDGTRPTMDRVKESLFGMIQTSIRDSVCLDLFAGSGSLGIECISNRAKKVYFVDNGKNVLNVLKRNLSDISEDYEIYYVDYMSALERFKNNGIKFDLIFLDPPYHKHYINSILDFIVQNNLLNTDGQVICEYEDEIIESSLTLLKDREYGSKNVRIYVNNG